MMDDEADADADDGLDFLARELLLEEDEPMGDVDEEDDLEEELIGHASRVGDDGATGPISMNQFAGGDATVEYDDDDYSSSEESEED